MDTNQSPQKLNLSVDLRLVVATLLVAIIAMLVIWKPWSTPNTGSRTVAVTGEAKVTAEPDEFVFYPNYQFKNADKEAALAELTKKSDEIVAKLKALGVPDNKIKTNTDGNDYRLFYGGDAGNATYTLQLTVTVANLETAQKVQDYLVTTTPTGSVSPQAAFSDKKRTELESSARDKATKDARTKVDQMAKNLSFTVGKVKSITDGSEFNTFAYPAGRATTDAVAPEAKTDLTVQPGENDLSYSVSVTYFIK